MIKNINPWSLAVVLLCAASLETGCVLSKNHYSLSELPYPALLNQQPPKNLINAVLTPSEQVHYVHQVFAQSYGQYSYGSSEKKSSIEEVKEDVIQNKGNALTNLSITVEDYLYILLGGNLDQKYVVNGVVSQVSSKKDGVK